MVRCSRSTCDDDRELTPPESPYSSGFRSRTFSEDEAATVIQSAFRKYKTRTSFPGPNDPKRQSQDTKRRKTSISFVNVEPRKGSEEFQNHAVQVLSMFSMSKEELAKRKMNRMSVSALPPKKKDYLRDNSLFVADRESVLVFGGVDPHSDYGVGRNTGKDVYRYLADSNVWEFAGELPEPRHYHAVAFLKGRVYMAGGADPRDDDVRGKSVVVSTVWSFEPVTRCWYSETGMSRPRKSFGLVVSHMKLYAIGGQDRNGRVLGSVERFEPNTGTWEEVAPLQTPRMGLAATKYRDYIWVAGGMTGTKENPLCSNVECYDTRRNQWTRISDLRFPRCFGSLFTMNDKLFLIGGAGRVTEKDRTTTSVGAIDVWDTKNRSWKLLTEMSIPRHGHAIAYLGTQILIIGGVTTVYMRALSNTECYCCERGAWVRGISGLPTTLSGHGSVTLPPASLM